MYKKKTITYTNIVIYGKQLKTYENDVANFEIAVYHKNGEVLEFLNTYIVNAARDKDGIKYIGTNNVEIKNLLYGHTYAFRIRTKKTNNSYSEWSKYIYKTAGDNTNNFTFDLNSKSVKCDSTGCLFSIEASNVPEDFNRLEWCVKTEDSGGISNPQPPVPSAPDEHYIPDYTTYNVNSIELKLTDSRTRWLYVWIRALDTSNNVGVDGWVYIGSGVTKPIDVTGDVDDTPPDNTTASTDSTFNFDTL